MAILCRKLFLEPAVANLTPGNALQLVKVGWSVSGVDWAEQAIELAN